MSNEAVKGYVERITRLEDEKKAIADDIKDIYAEAKSNGFNPAALRDAVKIAREDATKRAKREQKAADLDIYLAAIGQLAGTPLGEAGKARA